MEQNENDSKSIKSEWRKKGKKKSRTECLSKHLCIVLWKSGNLFARETLKGCTTQDMEETFPDI